MKYETKYLIDNNEIEKIVEEMELIVKDKENKDNKHFLYAIRIILSLFMFIVFLLTINISLTQNQNSILNENEMLINNVLLENSLVYKILNSQK